MDSPIDERGSLPGPWRDEIAAGLGADERVLAWFQPDLDNSLHYAEGLLVLTNQRLALHGAAGPDGPPAPVRSWPLVDVAALKTRERAGLGIMEVLGATGRLGYCRFTISRSAGAHRVVQRFEIGKERGFATDERLESACPKCGAILTRTGEECLVCAVVPVKSAGDAFTLRGFFRADAPLMRLVWFSKPRFGMIVLGTSLSLAGVAANMIWPYLTKSLIDDFASARLALEQESPAVEKATTSKKPIAKAANASTS